MTPAVLENVNDNTELQTLLNDKFGLRRLAFMRHQRS